MTVRGGDAQLKFAPATSKFKSSAKVLLCVFCCAEKQLFRQVSCILGCKSHLVNVAVVSAASMHWLLADGHIALSARTPRLGGRVSANLPSSRENARGCGVGAGRPLQLVLFGQR